MLLYFKEIFFIAVFCLLLTIESFSQINNKYSHKESINKGLKRFHSEPIDQSGDPNQELNLKDSRQNVIDFFAKERKGVVLFSVEKKNEKLLVPIDSLLPINKDYIDNFIAKNKSININDSQYLKNQKLKFINDQIKIEEKKDYNNHDKYNLERIFTLIEQLPNSIEKVGLLIRYAYLKIRVETDNDEVNYFCNSAQRNVEIISNLYEKYKCYLILGDFAENFYYDDKGIEFYYLALEAIEHSKIDSITKFNEQGIINQKLGYLFEKRNFLEANTKAIEYFENAFYYFKQGRNNLKANIAALNIISTELYVWVDFPQFAREYFVDDQIQINDLNNLKNGFYRNRNNLDSETNYLGYYSISTLLKGEKKNQEALSYALQGLYHVTKGLSNSQVGACLNNISIIYSLLGKGQLAIDYEDLSLYACDKLGDYFGYCNTLLEKGDIYYRLKKYDSALVYVNKIQFDTTLAHTFYSGYYNALMKRSDELKYDILEQIKSDSSNFYKDYYVTEQIEDLKFFSGLLETESVSKNNLILASDDDVIRKKELQINSLKEDQYNLSKVNNRLIADTLLLRKLNIKYSDSLLDKEKAIKGLNALTNYYDSLSIVFKDTANKYQAQAIVAKKQRKIAYWSFGFAIAVLIFVSVFLGLNINKQIRKNKKLKNEYRNLEILTDIQKQEAERISKENEENNYKLKLDKANAEMKLLSTLAINHDLDKFIPLLPAYIRSLNEESKSKLISATEKFNTYYSITKNIGSSLTNTVKAEVEIAQISAEVYLYIQKSTTIPNIVTNFSGNSEIENLEIPKNMITSFVANSINHRIIGSEKVTVKIYIEKETNGYSFLIEDNGKGFQSLNLEDKAQDKGINLILNQVKNYNENNKEYEIVFSISNIVNKIFNSGTIVTFKLLKKWQEETLS